MFFLFVLDGVTTGLLITHVDDILVAVAGNCVAASDSIAKLKAKVMLTVTVPPFVYCGKTIRQESDGSIYVGMRDSVAALATAHISKQRRADKDDSLTEEELHEMRSGFGSLGWVARQLRADIAFDVSRGQQAVGDARVNHLIMMNRVIVAADPYFELAFRLDIVDWT